jgi:hypothetical protein
MDSNTGNIYKCTAVENDIYTWECDEENIETRLSGVEDSISGINESISEIEGSISELEGSA